ncbi:MAG: SIMPL domain-containing protein [Candidatus Pacearchaeota archaeon]
MEKSVQITLIVVAGFILIAFLGFAAFSNFTNKVFPASNSVTGNGEAIVKTIPDLVGIYFSVETKASTSEEATSKNAKIVDELITNLVKEGFDRKDIQTLSFNVYPDYSWVNNQQKLNGYQATHQIKVELLTDDSGKIGDVIDTGVNAGAGISYINFELSQEKQNQYKSEALKLAAEDARIKANAIAEGLNKKLGILVSTSSSRFNYSPINLYTASSDSGVAEAKRATTNIQPGEQEISASVTVIYKLR